MDAWQQIKERLSARLPWESFQSWFHQTSYRGEDNGRLIVTVPNRETKDWIEREFGAQVLTAVHDLHLRISRIDYVLPGATSDPAPASSNGHHDHQQLLQPRDTDGAADSIFGAASALIERFTLDQFIVGSSNQFAHAAARVVAEQPARRYNPLFIYGGSGMGKTHLLHAIGNAIRARHPRTRVVYTTGERFTNQLVQSIRGDRMTLFHQHYRSADVLLVDDAHVLAGKERTQEEFFYTFNELHDHQKQIVLTSDAPPRDTPGLAERVRSRLDWGLVVELQAPDLETKLAIIDQKAREEGVPLTDAVRVLIATKTKSNVRELEAALVRLIALSSVTQSAITVEMARQALRHMHSGPERKTTIESVIKAVAEHFQMLPAQLKQKSNQRHIAFPRQVAMYLVKDLTEASLPEIGRAFGGKHHTTVLHSIQKIERDRTLKPDLNKSILQILDGFN